MSQALASARKRRAPASINPSPTPNSTQSNSTTGSQNNGLTLPQVISLVDRRLINLETFMNETRNNVVNKTVSFNTPLQNGPTAETSNNMDELGKYEELTEDLSNIVQEVNSRFELLAGEILEMKNIVLKLQSFTMDVNKTLLEERNFNMSSKDTNEETQPDIIDEEQSDTLSVLPSEYSPIIMQIADSVSSIQTEPIFTMSSI